MWPPPLCRVVMRPRLFRPPFFVSGSSSDFSGSDFVTSSKPDVAMKRRPGLVGLYFLSAIRRDAPSKISISWPGFSCTIAFFQPGRRPA